MRFGFFFLFYWYLPRPYNGCDSPIMPSLVVWTALNKCDCIGFGWWNTLKSRPNQTKHYYYCGSQTEQLLIWVALPPKPYSILTVSDLHVGCVIHQNTVNNNNNDGKLLHKFRLIHQMSNRNDKSNEKLVCCVSHYVFHVHRNILSDELVHLINYFRGKEIQAWIQIESKTKTSNRFHVLKKRETKILCKNLKLQHCEPAS